MKLSDYIIDFMEEKKVKTLFYVPGGGCMHLIDSLAGRNGLESINLLHEQSAAIAAENYAFTGEGVGAAIVTTGPGGTNTITGVLSSYLDSIPCFFLSGQVKTSDLKTKYGVRSHGSQEADIVSMVKEITKYAVLVTDKKDIRYHLERAWYEATHGRKGPVWVDIPLDIQGSDISPEELEGFQEPLEEENNYSEQIQEIVTMLREAKKPVIIAGNGLRESKQAFYRFLEWAKIPVIPTWKAVDLIENNHPLFVGKCGTLGDRPANFAVQTADLIISLGSKLDFSITGFDRSRWAVHGKKIVVDIDPAEINKLGVPIEIPIAADVKNIIDALNRNQAVLPDYDEWKKCIRQWKETYPVISERDQVRNPDTKEMITTYDLVGEIFGQAEENTVFVPASAGTVAEITYQAMKLKEGQMVRSNHGLGSMGYEIPSAIGAYYGSKKTIIVIAGDGGMQLNIQELAIIAGRKLPIKIFVVDNGGYSSIRNMQRSHFQGRYLGSNENTGLYLPQMTELARAYGIEAMKIEKTGELKQGIQTVLNSRGPYICNVKIDPFCIVSPRTASKVLEDGNVVSTPLEDLFPFLDENELRTAIRQGEEMPAVQ